MTLRGLPRYLLIVTIAMALGACSGGRYASRDSAPGRPPSDVASTPDAVPRAEPYSRYGNPESYEVFGKRYFPLKTSSGYTERGIASWYGTKFHGRRTSSGEPYDMYAMTAAHKTLPLPTYVQVTNLDNGRQVVVRVNDRGPFHSNRIIDLSYAAAARLDILGKGTGLVEVRALNPHSPEPEPVMVRAAPQETITLSPISSAHAATPEPAATTPNLYLQVGAFASRTNAERLQADLRRAALGEVHITTFTGLAGPVYRVRIGPLASVEEADRMVESLGKYSIGTPRVVID